MTPYNFLKLYAIENIHYNVQEELDKLIHSNYVKDRYIAALQSQLSLDQIDILVNDSSHVVRETIANNELLTIDQINKIMQDGYFARSVIAKHKFLTKEHIDMLIEDDNDLVLNAISKRLDLTNEQQNRLSLRLERRRSLE